MSQNLPCRRTRASIDPRVLLATNPYRFRRKLLSIFGSWAKTSGAKQHIDADKIRLIPPDRIPDSLLIANDIPRHPVAYILEGLLLSITSRGCLLSITTASSFWSWSRGSRKALNGLGACSTATHRLLHARGGSILQQPGTRLPIVRPPTRRSAGLPIP